MKIGITGVDGFIGRYLSNYFKERGFKVWEGNKVNCDVTKAKLLEKFVKECNIIIHLAVYQNIYDKNYENFKKINVVGALNVLKLAKRYKKRVILFSSEVVFGTGKDNYTKSKKAQLLMAKNYKNVDIVYPPVVLDLNKIISWWKLAPGGIMAAIGDGNKKINYIEIVNLSEYVEKVIKLKKLGKLPVKTVTKYEFLDLVSNQTGGFVLPFRIPIWMIRGLLNIFKYTKYSSLMKSIVDSES